MARKRDARQRAELKLMRSGGGAPKGSGFERECCSEFSLWISRGTRRDLFERNVSSGGAFTLAAQRGRTRGVPGDLMPVHPIAHQFLEGPRGCGLFFIEAKSWRDLYLDRAMWNPEEELCRVIRKQERLAEDSGRIFLLVAHQNRRKTLLMMDRMAAMETFAEAVRDLEYHVLWRGRIFVCRLDHAMAADPDEIVRLADQWQALRRG